MTISDVSVGGKVTAAKTNEIIGEVNTSGSQIVLPTSIANSSGSASLSTFGVVTFTSVASVSLNGVFDSSHLGNRIIVDVTGVSTNLNVNMLLRLAGTDNTSAVYDAQNLLSTNASTTTTSQSIAAALWGLAGATSALHIGNILIIGAGSARPTMGISDWFATLNPMTAATTSATHKKGLLHRNSTAYDGFTLSTSAGTMTGKVYVLSDNGGS